MNYYLKVLASAVVMGVVLTFAVVNDWVQSISYCEGFGCLGRIFIYMYISIAIVIIFFVCGFIFGPKPKFKSSLYAGVLSIIAVGVSIEAVSINNQLKIEKSMRNYDEACIEYPILCPERNER
ncbi:MAG: purine-cytosine permease-like protein [Bacteroidia bacterium]|jgi:purine-cytosine permease-like protein